MRILVANKFWFGRGGQERVMFDEIEALEAAGHEVAHFSTTHPQNDPSPYAEYFVPYIELGGRAPLSARDKVLGAVRLFDNRDAARRFARLIADFEPDIVHAHGIHRQISPSILVTAKRLGVPVVQTLHDLHKVCPQDLLFRAGTTACLPPKCSQGWYVPAVTNRCSHGSMAVSALAACELGYQRARRVYERCVSRFISPSRFLAERMRDGGWTSVPIDVFPNAVRLTETAPRGGHFLYAGRLAPGKGIEKLLEAAVRARVRVIVAGEGPMAEGLRSSYPDAEFVGWLDGDGVRSLLRSARATVLPSTCVENAPLAVIESMAAGVPVVASAIGGVPELLDDGREGILVPPGDVDALASALTRLKEDASLADALGRAGRVRAEQEYGMHRHLDALLNVYDSAIGSA